MRIDRVKAIRDEDGDVQAKVTIEYEEYEVQEMANQERDRIERGLSIGDARVAIDRYNVYMHALRRAVEEKRGA